MKLSTIGVVNSLSENAKIILSLDLAFQALRISFDAKNNSQYLQSGLKKSAYQNTKRSLEKILNLGKSVSISDLCIKLKLVESSGIIEKAEKMFKAFKDSYKKTVDFTHPQYAAIIVFTVCKLEKTKVSKKEFQAFSNLKTNQWLLLEKEFESWLIQSNFGKINGKEKSKGGSLLETVKEQAEKGEISYGFKFLQFHFFLKS